MLGYRIVGIYEPEQFRTDFPHVELELESLAEEGETIYTDQFRQHFLELNQKTWKYDQPKSEICRISLSRTDLDGDGRIIPTRITIELNDKKDLTKLPEAIAFAKERLQQANESYTETKQQQKNEAERKEAKRQEAVNYIKTIDKQIRQSQ